MAISGGTMFEGGQEISGSNGQSERKLKAKKKQSQMCFAFFAQENVLAISSLKCASLKCTALQHPRLQGAVRM
ncbi:hypothetical protein BH11PSE12_BH11PSE12_11940 [soil metagenome]